MQEIYNALKAVYPIKTTAREGVDIHELVKQTYPKQYKDYVLFFFNWNDLDGVLDYLYGLRVTLNINTTDIIKLIEANCEVKQ